MNIKLKIKEKGFNRNDFADIPVFHYSFLITYKRDGRKMKDEYIFSVRGERHTARHTEAYINKYNIMLDYINEEYLKM